RLRQCSGQDLPGEAELVLQPAAAAFRSAFCQLAPEVIDVLLRVAQNLERDRLGELEERSAVEGEKLQAVDLKSDGHDRSGVLAVDILSLPSIAADLSQLCVGKDRNVVVGCHFGLGIEPQARRDAFRGNWHVGSSSVLPCLGGTQAISCPM